MLNISRKILRNRPLCHHAVRTVYGQKGCLCGSDGKFKIFNKPDELIPSGLFGGLIIALACFKC